MVSSGRESESHSDLSSESGSHSDPSSELDNDTDLSASASMSSRSASPGSLNPVCQLGSLEKDSSEGTNTSSSFEPTTISDEPSDSSTASLKNTGTIIEPPPAPPTFHVAISNDGLVAPETPVKTQNEITVSH